MHDRSDNGPMICEPSLPRVAPGDRVRFVPTQPGHNTATIDGMIPEGAEPFKSKINEDFSVDLTVPGIGGIKRGPHVAMGMVMLIEMGDAPAPVPPEDPPTRARERFGATLAANSP
ncbi:plastocyanin/azurin family copper-binding protein [uncultured Amaricoccus sp.]|uniref:plastocyanin/azurin family copper-binding protein n=1 Tax=uncultured Amaricoccus sp. TaxID=339341 RepID=UPI002623CEF4|nr:plastocyanin/azurin family copper-binding protein [uncultured Amaricoccus sp.]